jgi:1-acyl-sn-glycerol-3-phosphate acyltransferase
MKWRLEGNVDFSKNTIKKAVIIAAPHTSWHDFYIGLLLRKITGIKANFIGKKELFKWPFGIYFRSIGGKPVDRSSKANMVEQIVQIFEQEEEFRLTLAPEGTRKKVKDWKTGFYYIAKEARVPIIMFTLDFEHKRNVISEPFYPSGDIDKDFQYIRGFFKDVKGKIPEYS